MFGILNTLSRRKGIAHEKIGGLSRCLTTMDLVSLSIGATLGAGIYVVTGQVAANIAGPAVILSFTIAVVASILSGLCYAEFGARVPHTTGSAYTYCYVTVGEFAAFVIGWNLILEYMIGSAADARALSSCFDYIIGHGIRNFTLTHIGTIHIPTLGDTYPDFLSCLLTLVVTGVLVAGVKQSSVFSTVFNVVNLGVVGFIIIAGSFYVKRENWSVKSGFFPYGASGVLSGAATCFYAFVGFDVIATTGQETKNPQRSIPLAIIISLFIVFMCYISVSSILTLILPYSQLNELSPIPNAFAQRGFHTATYIIGIGAICGLTSSLLGSLFPLPRIIYAMANDGLLFETFRKINLRTDIPLAATIFPGIMTSILALLFELSDLVEMMSIGTLLAYTLVSLCVLILRYQPKSHDVTEYSSTSFDFGDINVNDDQNSNDESDEFRELENLLNLEEISGERTIVDSGDHDESVENIVSYPTKKSGRIVAWASLLLFFSVFVFFALMIHGLEMILDKNIPIVIVTLIFGFLSLFCVGVIAAMPQNSKGLSFMVPCVPGIPILAVFFNIFLMLKLSRITWLRFLIWMVIGLAIYLFYGLRHSLVGSKMRTQLRAKRDEPPRFLARKVCEFDYDLDVIPAHRDLSEGKKSPISPIFWTSILNYHFFNSEDLENDVSNK